MDGLISALPDFRKLELQRIESLVTSFAFGRIIWQRFLNDLQQEVLGNDLEKAWKEQGTVRMWSKFHGGSDIQALVEIGYKVHLIAPADYDFYLNIFGKSSIFYETELETAIKNTSLVILEFPRTVHWQEEEVEFDWESNPALWEYFWTLCVRAKHGKPLDRMDLGEKLSSQAFADRKSRLVNKCNLPDDLRHKIESAGNGSGAYRLDLPSNQIRIFQLEQNETLKEL